MSIAQSFIDILESVIGKTDGTIALHEPEFKGHEWDYVKECLDTGWVSSVGKYVDEFEKKLREITGAKYAVAVSNGTSALHIALMLAGVKAGDEVLVPALSFVATANAVAHCGAIPHFVDSSLVTLGLDPAALKNHLRNIAEKTTDGWRNRITGRRLAAIVPMHTFGHMVDMDVLMELSGRYGIPVVEDAAESLGSRYKGISAGTFGKLAILSFNGNKIVTTGGGGAILTNDDELGKHAKYITTTAKRPHRWEFFHDEVAYNYRLPNINAALGCAQLERLPDFISRKQALAERYRQAFAGNEHFEFAVRPEGTESNYWLCAVRLKKPELAVRDEILGMANDAGYQCRPVWTLLHRLPMYQNSPKSDLRVAELLEASLINIPSSPKLGAA